MIRFGLLCSAHRQPLDSICYGCLEYKHVSETCIQIHLGDVDENGGVCDSSQMFINGDLNTFISNSVKGRIE